MTHIHFAAAGRLCRCGQPSSSHRGHSNVPAFATRAWRGLRCWGTYKRQLRALRELNDHLLRDIGVSRADVDRECSKQFWRTYARRHLK